MASKFHGKTSRADGSPTSQSVLPPPKQARTRAQKNSESSILKELSRVTTRQHKKNTQEPSEPSETSVSTKKRRAPTKHTAGAASAQANFKRGGQYRAVQIDVDGDESSAEDAPPKKKSRQAITAADIGTNQREEDEDGESHSEDGDLNMQDDSPAHDLNASRHLESEAVIITAMSRIAEKDKAVQPVVTVPISSKGNQISTLPQVSELALPMSRTTKSRPEAPTTTTPAVPSLIWLERTNIVVSCKHRAYSLTLSGQPPVMHDIIEQAINLGKIKMLFDHSFSPVGPSGLKQIAFAALDEVANKEGYDGEGDVRHRLAEGDHNSYVKPLIAYVSHRVGLDRSQLKDLSAVVLNAFGLSRQSGAGPATNLIQKRTYFYPVIDGVLDETRRYDYQRPFEHPVFSAFISAAFFSTSTYSNIVREQCNLFRCSLHEYDKQHENEVPKAMVAWASVVIHACLQDFASGVKESFPSKEVDGIWHLSISLLDGIEKANRRKFHKLMWNFYWDAIGQPLTNHSITNQQAYDKVDWSAIAQDSDSNSDSDEPGPMPQWSPHSSRGSPQAQRPSAQPSLSSSHISSPPQPSKSSFLRPSARTTSSSAGMPSED
ncbi:hypothetical protein F5050DRAFT_1848499 [Lentinula boryana]|uniref:DUF6532 domain-containing protein n=1 Tax=Lentinula boryana TaxID=40481 RepID=A0ABQ8Q3G1_9AGAR|nr:hypothetical protein F5050DRAFT_1848499 [Lentinula boryana]